MLKEEEERRARTSSSAAAAGGSGAAGSRAPARGSNDPFELPDFKPQIKIEYKDEFGRVIGPKEQFKLMSHVFHGKEPGKNHKEKRLRKFKEEQRMKSMSAQDTPFRMMEAVRKQQEKSGTAHVVLSSSVKH